MVVPWANGLGTTSIVARRPDDDDWTWRLSLADVTTDGPFSSLPGIDRHIVVATGAGMSLSVDRAPPVRLTIDSPPFAFDGGAEVVCALIDGPIVDLNLMVRSGTAAGSLMVHDVSDGARIDLVDLVACVVLAGSVAVETEVLGRFDAIIDPASGTSLTALGAARIASLSF